MTALRSPNCSDACLLTISTPYSWIWSNQGAICYQKHPPGDLSYLMEMMALQKLKWRLVPILPAVSESTANLLPDAARVCFRNLI